MTPFAQALPQRGDHIHVYNAVGGEGLWVTVNNEDHAKLLADEWTFWEFVR